MPRKLICVCAVMAMIGFCGTAVGEPGDLKKENADLQKKIERLEREVEKLKAQLDAREPMPRHLETKPLIPLIPAEPQWPGYMPPMTQSPTIAPQLKTLPPGTIERQFNGVPYYIIPIDSK